MNGMREKATVTEIEGGQIHFFKEDNKLVLIHDNIGVVIEPINNALKKLWILSILPAFGLIHKFIFNLIGRIKHLFKFFF